METRSRTLAAGRKTRRPPPSDKRMRWMFATLGMMMVLEGWNDGSLGPVIPFLQRYYHVDYLHMSIIFIVAFFGCATAGFGNLWLDDRFGFGYTATFGSMSQGISYVIMLTGPPYPIFVAAWMFTGFGFALQDAQCNALCSRLPNASTKISLLHALFGVGAFISPFFTTAFVEHYPEQVYLYFAIPLVVAVVTVSLLIIVFQGRNTEDVIQDQPNHNQTDKIDEDAGVPLVGKGEMVDDDNDDFENEKGNVSGGSKLQRLFKEPAVMYIIAFIIIYLIAIGGWAVSFLIAARGGNTDSGYVSAGYYGGIAVGRVVLIPVTNVLGHRLAVFVYLVSAILLEVCIMLAPSLFLDALAFSLVGVVIGPIYPAAIMVITEIIPLSLQPGTIGLMGAMGGAGSAMMPFVVGALSDRFGIWVLQPVIIALMVADLFLWWLIARRKRIPGLAKA